MSIYNSIGQSYSKSRIPDNRIVDAILYLLNLEKGNIIADIGAGTGGYSREIANRGFFVYAVEPSDVMRSQVIEGERVKLLSGYAENLPLADASVDAVICILAIHHFSNFPQAIREMHRVTKEGAFVFLTFEPRISEKLWIADYFPIYRELDHQMFPPLSNVVEIIEANTQRIVDITNFNLPHDLTDMFAAAGWRRPEIYLNSEVRAGISALALADKKEVEKGVIRLQEDLESGRWDEKYGNIRHLSELDAGYRFIRATL
ncbi:MAG: class I SAM-dependent methyltransferase [Calothrix sp. SM1_7_51]|nr:class I SAM-dependent methyltransferase [Calothrix sp. SM1_7_51]